MITVCKTFHFDFAHYLSYHKGKCANLHGHRGTIEVEVVGPIGSATDSGYGMILDFGELKKIVEENVLERLDHRCLNDVVPYPTAECLLGGFIVPILQKALLLLPDITLIRARLYETPDSWAEWRP